MIRLIACDLDGTLISAENQSVPDEVFVQIRRLMKKGILFCPCSGRQLISLEKLFAPVADDLLYIAENGGAVYENKKLIYQVEIPRDTVMTICHQILSTPGCDLLISCDNMSYLCTKDEKYIHHMRYEVKNNVTVVEKPEDVPYPIMKVSAYSPFGPEKIEEYFRKLWGDQFEVAIAGKTWLDFTKADKGMGLSFLCGHLGIPLSDVAAFGDNYNDVPMLNIVGHPYIMNSSVMDLKNRYSNHCHSVVDILKQF